MAKKRGRGGYRKPTPTRKNAVSGPGALSQRTDGAQPVMRLPDAKYGESKDFEQQQQAAPLGDSGGANSPLPMGGPVAGPNVFGPTDIPGQPPTEGIPFGAGAPPMQDMTNNVDILLSAMYAENPHPLIAQLINGRSR